MHKSIQNKEKVGLANWGRAIVVSAYGSGAVLGGVYLSEHVWLGLGFIVFGLGIVFIGAGWPHAFVATSRLNAVLWTIVGVALFIAFAAQIALRTLI